ncbi:hypothetical protein, partial [Peribacillus psychrosaccharolyticus]|uniref:hypothetical protein n=1 Tax=Peribacillus psychrosaccharolyticus TaxID=1407 RepID=UPI001F2625D6
MMRLTARGKRSAWNGNQQPHFKTKKTNDEHVVSVCRQKRFGMVSFRTSFGFFVAGTSWTS